MGGQSPGGRVPGKKYLNVIQVQNRPTVSKQYLKYELYVSRITSIGPTNTAARAAPKIVNSHTNSSANHDAAY